MLAGERLVAAYKKVVEQLRDPAFSRAVVRVESRLVENYLGEVKAAGFTLTSDEKIESGGTGKGPTPLEYFLAGLAFCEQVIFIRHAAANGLLIDGVELSVRGYFDRRGAWAAAEVDPAFQEIVTEISITGPEREERIREAVARIHKHCPVYNTLKKATKITEVVLLNGKRIAG